MKQQNLATNHNEIHKTLYKLEENLKNTYGMFQVELEIIKARHQ